MGIKIEEGKLRIAAGYTLKIPLEGVDYGMQDAHISISLEADTEGDSTAIIEQAASLEAALATAAKLAVFTQLGVTYTENNGVLVPQVKATPKVAAAPKVAYSTPASAPSGGGQQAPYVPKASKEEIAALPTFVADFGKGLAQYTDLRPLKQSGKFSPRAADFRSVVNKDDQAWLTTKEGAAVGHVVEALTAAGVDIRPFDQNYGQ